MPRKYVKTGPRKVKLRDPPKKVRLRLGMSAKAFDNFKHFARQTHSEYCQTHPGSAWADNKVVWTAIPEKDKLDVIKMLDKICREAGLFPAETVVDLDIVESGIEQRLFQVRRTWQQSQHNRIKRTLQGRSIAANKEELQGTIEVKRDCLGNALLGTDQRIQEI